MKWLVLLGAAASAVAVAFARDEPAPAPADAPASAPAGPPKPKTLETLRLQFEIMNFNYYDLTKQTCPEEVSKKRHKKHPKLVNAKKPANKKTDKKDASAETGVDMGDMPSLPDAGLPDDLTAKPPYMDDKESPWGPKGTPPKPAPAQRADSADAIDEIHSHSDSISDAIKNGLGAGGGGGKTGLPWMDDKKKNSFLQLETSQLGACVARQDVGETTSTECTSIMDVLRDTVKDTVRGIINCLYMQSIAVGGAAPGPAPMAEAEEEEEEPEAPASIKPAGPAPASFLQIKPSKGKAPAPATASAPSPAVIGPPPKPDLNIFVTFAPGRKVGAGRSTIVEVAFLDTPGNGVDDVAAAKPFIIWCDKNGMLNHELGNALHTVTSIHPIFENHKLDTEAIEQWDIQKCEAHITALVKQFSNVYTRSQVPMALYNECTNFMTKMSFSHDYVLDPLDTQRCRKATRKFEHKWEYGKNAEEKDFEGMCFNACEAKYGRNSPTCNIQHGDKLLGQPL